MIIDEEAPPSTTTSDAPYDSVIQVAIIPTLGTLALVKTSQPDLLFVDKDERPDWLIMLVDEFLWYVPYYMCLSKVVDLFLTQEGQLGYPVKVSKL